MDKKKKEILMLAGLGFAFALIFIWSISATSKKLAKNKPATALTQSPDFGAFSPQGISLGTKEKSQSVKVEPEFGRDPFIEKAFISQTQEAEVKKAALNLEGISWDANSSFAVINSAVVVTGDAIEGYKVIEIKQFSVLLDKDGEQIELRL